MALPEAISTSQLDSTFGCVFLAGIVTSIFWGVGCLQLWLYYEKHSKIDRFWFKIYVFLIWALDLAHQVFVIQYLYSIFVDSIANPLNLGRFPRSGINTAIMTALVDVMVQTFFLRRVWFISGEGRIVTGILCLFVIGQFGATTTIFGQMYNVTELAQLATLVHTQLIMASVSVATDTALALTLIYFLWIGRTGVKRTDTIVNRLIAYAIGTGLVTALCATAALISAEVVPNGFVYVLFDFVAPKLYFNCMLTSLNARMGLREALDVEAGLSIQLENSAEIVGSNLSTNLSRKETSLWKRARTLFTDCGTSTT